ncbi:MAG: hypothetical protein K1X64_14575 [Myxococcaceae bacterium]|nr:hypothetical protein [Myxococcaceae bacterium]
MPVRLTDSKLKSLYTALEKSRETDSSVRLGSEQALTFLAAAADRSNASYSKVLTELKAPGLSRDAQVALVKRGMTASEKADLVALLDGATLPWDTSAKSLLEAVVGRDTFEPFTILGNQLNGLRGTARPGDKIEAINITAAPAGRLHMDDTTVVATANANGTFSAGKLTGDQAMREGDFIRIRARHADGSADEWTTIKATGLASSDERNAVVALFRIGLSAAPDGKVNVANINIGRQISEPGAKLQFTNLRTREKTVVTLNEEGSVPESLLLKGQGGDEFSIAATDGTHNLDFKDSVGKLTVAHPNSDIDVIKDPGLDSDDVNSDGTPKFGKKRFTGPLFKNGISYTDPKQGQLGNCYVPSGIAAVAFFNPAALEKIIEDNGDGTYTVTFKQYDWNRQKYLDVPIRIDSDLYVRSWGGPLYGASNGGDVGESSMELWYPLIEKAYAQWKGSYNNIGSGGHAGDVMQAVLGRRPDSLSVTGASEAEVWSTIKKAIDGKQPMAAGTHGEDQAARFTNTGVYSDHSYSVIGYEEKAGVKYVKLRNPWGESEPSGNGANDGIFKLPLATFMKLYDNLDYMIAGR